MKIIYLDHNIYGEFVSKKIDFYNNLYNYLLTLVNENKIIIPYSLTHIQETINRPNPNSILEELKIINSLSKGAMQHTYGKNCTIVFKDAFNSYNDLKATKPDLIPELQEAFKVFEKVNKIFLKIGFNPLIMNNKSYKEITNELSVILKSPEKYKYKINESELAELEESSIKMLTLLCSGSIRLLQEASQQFKEVKKDFKALTQNHIKKNQDIPDFFIMIKDDYKTKIKEYRVNIKKCNEQIQKAIKISSGVIPISDKIKISSYDDLVRYFNSTLSENKIFQFQEETVLVSLLEMAGHFPDSEKRKREVKKKGYFLEMFDMPHFNNSLFCQYFITKDKALLNRIKTVFNHLGLKKPILLFPEEIEGSI